MIIFEMLSDLSFSESKEGIKTNSTNGKYAKWYINPYWLTLEDNSIVRSYQFSYMFGGFIAYSNRQSLEDAVRDVYLQVIEARKTHSAFNS